MIDYEPAVKYHFPVFQRGNMWGGVERICDVPYVGANNTNGDMSSCEKINATTKMGTPASLTVGYDEYGRYVRCNGSAVGIYPSTEVGGEAIRGQVRPDSASGKFTIAIKTKFHNAAGTNQYPAFDSNLSTIGWYLRRQSSSNYFGLWMFNAGTSILFSNVGIVTSDVWEAWCFVVDSAASAGAIYQSNVDQTLGSAGRMPSANTGGDLVMGANAATDNSYTRFTLYNRALTHEERAMWEAGLM